MVAAQQYEPFDVEEVLKKLSVQKKVAMLGGKDFWHFVDAPEHGVPSIRTSDGPNGVRGQFFFNGTPSSCTPCETGLAASFDVELVKRIGGVLGDECRAKGVHVLLGPTTNMQRSPLGGRGFESFSEDPHLSGHMAAAYINGLQEKGAAACLKHFACNDQEFERFSVDSVVSQRALREIYLEPFRLAVKHSNPKSFMTAYNRLNGLHASEAKWLLDGILRKEWGWKGLIMSDWTGVMAVDESVKAGLDVEMPGPPAMRGDLVYRAFRAGKLSVEDVDERVRNLLDLANYAIKGGIPFDSKEDKIDTPELRAILRESAANGVVLLKNDQSLLPLISSSIKGKKIAVIGSNAKVPFPTGGGACTVAETYLVSALEGITAAAEEAGATVAFETGVAAFRYVPAADQYLTISGKKEQGGVVEFVKGSPKNIKRWVAQAGELESKPDAVIPTPSSNCFMVDGVPGELGNDFHARFTATFTPDISGPWTVGLSSIGFASAFLDGQRVVENVESYESGETFVNMGSKERRAELTVEAGKEYKLEKSDFAIVVVGTNPDWESEGFDRKDLRLPGETDALVSAVLAANPNTIIVNQSGTPVEFPWLKDASTLLQAFFGGNELGNGIADVLFGKINPSSKLPLTFPARLEDNPSFHSFGITTEIAGKTLYSEGIYVGYRHYDRARIPPAFPFGHAGDFTFSFTIENTGALDGAEVAQVYIAAPSDGSRIISPVKELKGFAKVHLKAGESKTAEVKLGKEAFSYFDEARGSWVAPAGTYRVLVATSSAEDAAKLEGEVKLETELKWLGL
ncbi:hypothetical protein JCM8097_007165 [Rhodosporidiobolus ruineniae]